MASDQNIGWDEASSAIVIPSAESQASHCVETGTGRAVSFDGLVEMKPEHGDCDSGTATDEEDPEEVNKIQKAMKDCNLLSKAQLKARMKKSKADSFPAPVPCKSATSPVHSTVKRGEGESVGIPSFRYSLQPVMVSQDSLGNSSTSDVSEPYSFDCGDSSLAETSTDCESIRSSVEQPEFTKMMHQPAQLPAISCLTLHNNNLPPKRSILRPLTSYSENRKPSNNNTGRGNLSQSLMTSKKQTPENNSSSDDEEICKLFCATDSRTCCSFTKPTKKDNKDTESSKVLDTDSEKLSPLRPRNQNKIVPYASSSQQSPTSCAMPTGKSLTPTRKRQWDSSDENIRAVRQRPYLELEKMQKSVIRRPIPSGASKVRIVKVKSYSGNLPAGIYDPSVFNFRSIGMSSCCSLTPVEEPSLIQ